MILVMPKGSDSGKRMLSRREKFRTLDIYLPLVNWVEGVEARRLDYEGDVLARLDWSILKVSALADTLAKEVNAERSQMLKLTLADGQEFLKATDEHFIQEAVAFDPVYATRSVVDIVPNPWVARSVIADLLSALRERGFDDDKLGASSSYILEELRKWLQQERDLLAEKQFMSDVAKEHIQFRLRVDRELWQMPKLIATGRPETARQLARTSGGATEKSLFSPVYDDDFNSAESEFACYLDEASALRWWHRNVAKSGYSIQGWKKSRVYPDFIFARERSGRQDRILVWEMKGDQLEGNLDTAYKRKLLETVSTNFRAEAGVKAGTLELVGETGQTVECDLVLMSGWKTEVSKILGGESEKAR
jgi:type III restriction enzyme